MNKHTALTIGLIIALVLIGYFVWSTNQADAPTDTHTMDDSSAGGTQLEGSENPDPGGVMVGGDAEVSIDTTPGEKSFTVTGSNFAFSQKEMRVKKGDTVRVTFTNTAGTHDWKLEGYNVGTKVLSQGASETVTFTADKTGSFTYYCSVGSHRAMGMVGTLIVEE